MSSAHVFSQSNWLWLKSAIISLNCKSVIADQDNKIPLAGAGLRAVIEGQAPASLTEPDIETEFRLIGHKGDLIAHERGLTTDEPCRTACESRLVSHKMVAVVADDW